MQHLTRTELATVIAALALVVVGVSLVAVPTTAAPAGPRTVVEAVTTSPTMGLNAVQSPAPIAVAAPTPSPIPPPVAAPAAATPIAMTGPDHIQPWQTAVYRVTFTGSGWRDVSIWWSGAAMARWGFQMLSGHCDVTTGQDRLDGRVEDTTVIELDLTPSGWPGGQLVVQGRQADGAPLGLAVVQVAGHG